MTLQELHDDIASQMLQIREERFEYVKMVHNAKLDRVEYYDWPQYARLLEITARWYVLREIKEIVAHIIDPTLEETELFGRKNKLCLLSRQRQLS